MPRPRFLFLLLTLAATGVVAQSRHNSNAPIDFSAGHIELQDKANQAILSGGVVVRQAEMTLEAARITVAYTGSIIDGAPEASRLSAAGGVTVTRPGQSARGNYGVYDLNRHVITMVGDVTLTQAGNTVNGGRLTIDLDTGRAVIDGSAAGGTATAPGTTTESNGRVTGRFSVPDRND